MMSGICKPYLAALVVGLLAGEPARPLSAQPPTEQACEAAKSVLAAGERSGRLTWAATAIPRCRTQGGQALAAALQAHARSRNVPLLDTLTRAAAQLRDAGLYQAAYEVAGSSGATAEARVFAIRTLLYTLNPFLRFTHAELSGVGAERNCGGHSAAVHDLRHWTGSPLPRGYDDRIRELGRRLAQDPATPPAVKGAAFCASLHRAIPWQEREPVEGPEFLVRPKTKP